MHGGPLTGGATGIVFDESFREHACSPGHPECAARLDAALAGIRDAAPAGRLAWLPARDAGRDELEACHAPAYLDRARAEIEGGAGCLGTGDTEVCPASWRVAVRAAGAAAAAVEAVLAGRVVNAFCPVRPPGHHAGPVRGQGFCILNNVAVAARRALALGIRRVAIVDWDAHHGNGTQDIFYEDPAVLYVSLHRWPHYPGTGRAVERGAGAGRGTTINCPLAVGSTGRDALEALRVHGLPALRAFAPELILVSAGFDSRAGDFLGGLMLHDGDYAEMTRLLDEAAAGLGHGRLVSVLEGGYALDGLRRAVAAHVGALLSAAARRHPAP